MDWLSRLNAAPPPASNGVEIYHWSYAARLSDNVLHRHTFFEVCLVGARGAGVFTVEETPLPIERGDLFIARPGVLHRIHNTGAQPMELFWLAFDWRDTPSDVGLAVRADIGDGASEFDNCNALFRALALSAVIVVRGDDLLNELWRALRSAAGGPNHMGKDAQLAGLQSALLLQIAAAGAGQGALEVPLPDPTSHRLAHLGARYIHDNMARKLGIAEIAAHLHLSPRHFQRLFVEFAAVSPSVYLETARTDRARHLLRSTDEPIKSIAAAVGLPDVHHFTRVFGRRCGIAPAAYRRSERTDVRIVHKEGALV